jgi:hypothetical protein
MIALGLILGGIVTVVGGRTVFREINNQFSDQNRWLRFDIFNIVGEIFDRNIPGSGIRRDLYVNGAKIAGGSYSADLPAAGVRELDIEAGLGLFDVRSWEGETIRLEIKGMGTCKYKIDSDGSLSIEGFGVEESLWRDWQGPNINPTENRLALYLPADLYYNEIEASIGVGELSVSDLAVGHLEGETGVGRLTMNNITADRLTLQTGVGVAAFSGAVRGNIKAETSIGSIDLRVSGQKEDYNYIINCSAGSITVGGDSYSGLAAEQTVYNKADKDMDLKCSIGNIEVKFY